MFLRAAAVILLCLLPVYGSAQSYGQITGYSALAGPKDPYADSADPAAGSGPLWVAYGSGKRVAVADDRPLALDGAAQGVQTDFDDIQLASDRRTLGWLAESMACAQSYPCALELVVFRDGRIIRRFTPEHGIIWFWEFLGGGRQVAIQSGFPHGDATGAFNLYDIASGKLLDKYMGAGVAPGWVRDFKDPLNP